MTLAAFVESPDGVWRHMLDVADALMERDAEVGVAVPRRAARLRLDARSRGIPIRELGDRSSDLWHVHLHDTLDRDAIRALLPSRRTRQATVVTEHLRRNQATDPTAMPAGRTRGA